MSNYRLLRLHELDSDRGMTLENGCRFVECLKKGEIGDLDATLITIPARRSTQPHRHARTRCFVFVVDGQGEARLNDDRRRVALNDFVLIEPGVTHQFRAFEEAMTLLSIHSPGLSEADGDLDLEYV
jgi:quercetin dioxygenase-like cupin family protein